MNKLLSFSIRLFGLSFIIEIFCLGWMYAMPQSWSSPTLPYLPPFFLAVTFMIHKTFLNTLGKNPRQFVTRYMLITTVKLLSFLGIIFLYAFIKPDDAMVFSISFLILYIIYSAFEAVAVIKLNNDKS